MGRPSLAKRLVTFVVALGAWLLVLEGLVRLVGLEERLPKTPDNAVRYRPLLDDQTGKKRLVDFTHPPERDGRPLTRVETITEPDPVLLWRLKRDAIWEKTSWVVRTNSLGFRDREFPRDKAPTDRFVLCLGDSVTFGWGLDEPDRWTSLLEAALNDRAMGDTRFRVLNGGIYGYSSAQGRALLDEGSLLALRPDAVVLTFGANDATGPGRALTDMLARPRRGQLLLDRLALYRCFARALAPARDRYLVKHAAWVGTSLYRRNVDAMIARVKEGGAAPVVMAEVVTAGVGEERLQRLPEYADIARQLAEARGVPFIDLPQVFSRHIKVGGVTAAGGEEPSAYFLDASHPNRRGSEVIARALSEALAVRVFPDLTEGASAGAPPP